MDIVIGSLRTRRASLERNKKASVDVGDNWIARASPSPTVRKRKRDFDASRQALDVLNPLSCLKQGTT